MDSTLSTLIEQRNTAQQAVNDLTAEISKYIDAQQRELAATLQAIGVTVKQERRGTYRRNAATAAKQSEAMRKRWAEARANGTRVNAPNGAVQ